MKIKAYFNRIDLSHKDFDYLEYKEKKEIEQMLITDKAKIVEFKAGNKHLASAIFTLEGAGLHAREIAGNFPEIIEFIERFACGLAIALKKDVVTFAARRDGVKKIGEKLGYKTFDNNPDEMYKVVA